MLVQFMMKNVLSFKEETVIDLSAIPAYKEHEYNLINYGEEKFLKVASIYGANASGKSNFFVGWNYFQKIIQESFNNSGDEFSDELEVLERYYNPFRFEEEKENSEFQIITIIDGYEYRYGFEYNDTRIVSEWLYRKSDQTKRTSIILERTEDSIYFGASVKKECDRYKEQIPKETLALSFFNKLSLKTNIFSIVYNEAAINTLVIDTDDLNKRRFMDNMLVDILKEKTLRQKLVHFLESIDTGIKDIQYEYDDKKVYFYTVHIGKNQKQYTLNLFNESEGTIKSIIIFILAHYAILSDKSLFFDELNTKLHPLLLKFIIDLFYNSNSQAQLIYTTHDTTLLDKKFFRRDQIWFVQKDEYGYSELTPLSDFKVRSDASFEKDYLAGVYGGIPLLKDFQMKAGD